MEKGSAGAGEGISVLGARLPVAVSSPRSTDAQARTQSCRSPLLVGVADHHLAGGQDLGVREHLFCFARQIAVWRHAFESWRERVVMQSDDIDRFFLFCFVHCLVFGGI